MKYDQSFNFKLVIVSLLLTIGMHLNAQNYLWPTSASKHLSSSFCEYRPAHYHSAIDIKTWDREGYPVYAVDNGVIYRIRVSPFGYGKALYLKLKDGHFAVYGHLKKFNTKLEQAIRQIQLKRQRYSIDWRPENWKVKKGELMAYTGQTGIGVPHLHFEIRDSRNHPLNPLMFYKNEIKDTIAPILQELLVIPLSANSLVNGSHLPQIIPLIKSNDNFYHLKDSLSAYGKIGLAVRSYDQANGVYNRFTFYQAHLFWDGHEVFSVSYDTLNFNKTYQADVEIYYPFKTLLKKRFRKMFIESFNTLPFYVHSPGNGYLTIKNKNHRFRLTINDFFGNISIIRGYISAESPDAPYIDFVRKFQNYIFLKLILPKNTENIALYTSSNRLSWKPVDYFEILANQFNRLGKHILLIKADINHANNKFVRLKVIPKKAKSYSCQICLNDSLLHPSFKLINAGKRWVLKAQGMTCSEDLSLQVYNGQRKKELLPAIYGKSMEAVSPAPNMGTDTLHLKLTNAHTTLLDTGFSYHALFPNKRQSQSFFNGQVKIKSFNRTVYDTLIYTVKMGDSLPKLKGIPVLSPVYCFNWYPQIFRKPALLSIKLNKPFPPLRRVAIYVLGKNHSISLVGGKMDSSRRTISTKIKTLGNFILAADTSAPSLEINKPAQNAILARLKEIQLSVDDTLSGIGTDRHIHLFLDGKFIIPEWDPERHLLIGRPYWKLKPGIHKIEAIVQDNAGNIAKKFLLFTIKK